MPVTVKVNGAANSLVHKGSNGVSVATIPDVCKTPSPGGPVPIPYPNISQSVTLDKGSTTVKADGMMIGIKGSEFSLSNGDNPGVAMGVTSNTVMKESTWILYSFDVKIDGQNACRLTDKKFQNHQNTADLGGVLQPPVAALLTPDEVTVGNCLCEAFCDMLKQGFKKGPRGGYRKKKSWSKRHNWSYKLEQQIKASPPACLGGHNVTITERFPAPPKKAKTIPDATFRAPGSMTPTRCFDFKFPGDRFRGGSNQKARLKKLSGNDPVEISHKGCACT